MKILHILSTPRAEGTPNLVLDWLGVPGHEQEVFVLHRLPADLSEDLRVGANSYAEAELFQGRGVRKFLRIVAAVRHVCAKQRPDLVICWPTGFANWVAMGARLALGLRVRLLAHCGNPPNRGRRADWISRSVLWPFSRLGGKCACCSDYVRNLYRAIPGLPPQMFDTIYNCVRAPLIRSRAEASREQGLLAAHQGPLALMVATLEAHKDHATLLRAWPAVLLKRPDFHLVLIGEGSLRRDLESLSRQLGLGERVAFLGARRDVAEWLGRADLFVFSTTQQEGLGSVLLEALAVGLPIVASDVPACRETLQEGRFGCLVAPGDSAALAEGILRTQEAVQSESARCAAQDYALRFTPGRMLQEYLKLAQVAAPECLHSRV